MENDYIPIKILQYPIIFLLELFMYQILRINKMSGNIFNPHYFFAIVATVNNPKTVILKELNADYNMIYRSPCIKSSICQN